MMEEQRLRAHLVRLYAATVAIVLFVVLAVMTLLFWRETEQKNRENFLTLLTSVTDRIQRESVVGYSELSALERQNRLLLKIDDNGEQLIYNSADSAEKVALLEDVTRLAEADGYDASLPPLTRARRTSPIYAFRSGNARYLSAVSILPQQTGYRALTMAQRVENGGAGRLLLYAGCYVTSVLLLGVLGVRLIDRALLPAVESRKRQTQFIAAASHELRSPLAVISANAATLRARDGAEQAAVDAIGGACTRMSRLIGDLLLLAASDAGSWQVTLVPLEVDTVLLNVYEAYAPLYRREGCMLSLELPETPLPRVRGDAERLTQVLGILLDNALSYGVTAENRTVTLRCTAEGAQAVIAVVDHGAGLSDADKAQAFERFYRGDAARREKQHFGLGLSIARELTALQRGRLAVSDTPGGGCTFTVTLG